jgi:hypothetical protein
MKLVRTALAGSVSPAGIRLPSVVRTHAAHVWQSSIIRKILGGLLITTAILAITYSAAATLVDGAASRTHARTNHAIALQQAAVNYRHARAQCQRFPEGRRDTCIAEAHAEEDRGRTMASLAPHSHVAALRSQTDAAIDAGDRDSIVVEPACIIVARGQASICEIQVKPNPANALAEAATERPLLRARTNIKAGESRQLMQPRANAQPGTSRTLLQVRASSEAGHHETYFFNLAANSH